MTGPRLTPLVESLPATVPFVGPETQERARGRPFAARVGANESVFGPSPHAVRAMAEAAAESWKYGDPESHDLKAALSAKLGIPPEAILVGEGIDGLLGYVARLTVGPGDTVVTSDGAYPTFNYHVAGFGGTLHKVPFGANDREDIDALLKTAEETSAKLVYLCNPDNPMGTWHDATRIQDAVARTPDGTLLVLDEAYAEFAPQGTVPPLDISDRRVIRMRTFSKAYGLAGLRVGYAVGHPDLIRAFDRIRNHFGMSRLSQIGATAALEDEAWLTSVIAQVTAARQTLTQIAAANGLTAIPSAANFVTIDCGGDAAFAKIVLDQMVQRDVFVRMPFAAPGNRCIRITCGTDADMAIVARVLPKALDAARTATNS